MTSSVQFPDFEGKVVKRPENYEQRIGADAVLDDYTVHAYQFATTHKVDVCTPSAIIYATNDEDIKLAINYANELGIAVAVRSGGHHYSGASSTTGNNIQLDMSSFQQFSWCETTGVATCGVGLSIGQLSANLAEHGAFVPHGQCSTVCLGGHMQTGGFSPHSGRSFGFLADHVIEFRIITADLKTRVIKRPATNEILTEDDELFSVVMGGSPGNFGIVTELKLKALFDKDYPETRMATYYTKYTTEAYTAMMQLLAEYNDNNDLPADFNLSTFTVVPYLSTLRPTLITKMSDHRGVGATAVPAHVIGMWVSWYNLDGGEYTQEAKDFFAHVDARLKLFVKKPTLLDTISQQVIHELFANFPIPQSHNDEPVKPSWISQNFAFPNRTYGSPLIGASWISDLGRLSKNGFVKWAVDNMEELADTPGLHPGLEYVVMGGKHSKNIVNGNAYPNSISGRQHLRLFAFQMVYYEVTNMLKCDWDEPKEEAHAWFWRAKAALIGPEGVFATKDRRFKAFANCVDDYDLDKVRDAYFDSEEEYQRVLGVKRKIDPKDIFTPNTFCVGASSCHHYENKQQSHVTP